MKNFARATALTVAAVLACGRSDPTPVMGDIEFAAARSGEPNLFATSDGRAMLTWLEEVGPLRHALRMAVREGGAWSTPMTIRESEAYFVNWADFPSFVELADGTWVVHWLEKVAANTYAYHVKLAMSRDRGVTWSDPIVPHRDRSPTEHGFVSLVPWGDDAAALIWLDGQGMTGADGSGAHGGADPGEMSIRATTITAEGVLGPDVLLDDRTCECCQTALARSARGLVAAYRDRSDTELRNIAVTRLVDGAWTEPVAVHEDGWRYPGCPVNGPQLSATGDNVAIAWFTAPDQRPATYAAFSTDGGTHFGEPIRVDDGDPLGRVDVELLRDGSALVTWLERTETAAEIRGRVVRPSGRSGSSWPVAVTAESRASGFPRIARVGDEILFAWTVLGADGGIRVSAARFGDLE